MRKSNILKLSTGVAFAASVMLAGTQAAQAQTVAAGSLAERTSHVEPGVSLVMPFDVTPGHKSFQLVSRKGGGVPIVATHWSFWSDSCRHLGDVFICLTDNDTIVVDPSNVQSQIQSGGQNINVGAPLDFTGDKGFVTVSQFAADPTASICAALKNDAGEFELLPAPSLVGSWVIANQATSAAFGNNAIAFLDTETPQNIPITTDYFFPNAGLQLQFFNPVDLDDSEIYVIGISQRSGNGEFKNVEIGPIPSNLGGVSMCCNAEYYDNIEVNTSIPDLCFSCASFASLTETLSNKTATPPEPFLIPALKEPKTSGFLSLTNCVAAGIDGIPVDLNLTEVINDGVEDNQVFPFAFHGMALGPFGTSVSGKYTIAGGGGALPL